LLNFATGRSLLGTHHLLVIADACTEPASVDELARVMPEFDTATVSTMVARLRRATIVYMEGERQPAAETAMRAFARWNPSAGFFHTSTKDVHFGGRIEGESRQRARARQWPMPAAVKHFRGRPHIRLPKAPPSGELASTLLARRTWRQFDHTAIELTDLSSLLALTAGIQAWVPVTGLGRVALRTAPSGGSRHPLDVYVLVNRVRRLRRGFYYYAGDGHALVHLPQRVSRNAIARYIPEQPWYEDAAVIVFFVANFERSLWRYDYSRAYRAVLIEAGHLCQTFLLVATSLGLAPFCTMALSDREIDRDLALDGIGESVMYAAGVGHRPAHLNVAIAPKAVRAPRPVSNPSFSHLLRRGRRTR
jgi:SagB-type dehydrogenase family enzyme